MSTSPGVWITLAVPSSCSKPLKKASKIIEGRDENANASTHIGRDEVRVVRGKMVSPVLNLGSVGNFSK